MIKIIFEKYTINKINKLYLHKLYINGFGSTILKQSKLLNCTRVDVGVLSLCIIRYHLKDICDQKTRIGGHHT